MIKGREVPKRYIESLVQCGGISCSLVLLLTWDYVYEGNSRVHIAISLCLQESSGSHHQESLRECTAGQTTKKSDQY